MKSISATVQATIRTLSAAVSRMRRYIAGWTITYSLETRRDRQETASILLLGIRPRIPMSPWGNTDTRTETFTTQAEPWFLRRLWTYAIIRISVRPEGYPLAATQFYTSSALRRYSLRASDRVVQAKGMCSPASLVR